MGLAELQSSGALGAGARLEEPAGPLSAVRRVRWPRGATWGLADQGLMSASNFLTMLIIARGLGPSGFGAFTLAYTALLLANTVQSALVTQPHNVLAAARHGAAYASYTASTAVGQVLIAAVAGLLAVACGALAAAAEWSAAALILALAPTLVAWQLQEFVRRVFYTEGRRRAAFVNDAISYGGQVIVIAILWRRGALTGPGALYAIAGTSAVAAAVGSWQLRRSLTGRVDAAVLRENWRFGKWLAGAEAGAWVSSQFYVYLAAGLLDTAAAGGLRAAQVLTGPLNPVLRYLGLDLPIRFRRKLTAAGEAALHAELKQTFRVTIPLFGGYCLLVGAFAGPLLGLTYGAAYERYAVVLALFAAYRFVTSLGPVVSASLKARGATRAIFTSRLSAISITVTLGWLMVMLGGAEGAVVGMLASALTLNLLLWRGYRRSRGADRAHVAPAVD